MGVQDDDASDDDYEAEWWGPIYPDFLVIGSGDLDTSPAFAAFAAQLDKSLQVLGNRPTLAMPVSELPSIGELPDDVFGVVTNDQEVAAWALGRGIPLVVWRELPTNGFEVSVGGDRSLGESFQSSDMVRAALRVKEILESLTAAELSPGIDDESAGFGVSTVEHQRLEVVISAAYEVVERHTFDPDDRALLQAAVETMQLQLRTSKPDRVILGRALNRVAGFTGGLITGVAANYLFSLLPHFHT